MILDDIKAFEFDKNKDHKYGLKSAIIWGYAKSVNSCSPLLYISKPKALTEEEFNDLLDRLNIYINVDR